VRKIGYILASDDCVALDYVACDLIGFKPREAPTVFYSRKWEISTGYELIGKFEKIDNFKRADSSKSMARFIPFSDLLVSGLAAKPVLIRDKCIKCGNCKRICPADAISMCPHPIFDYKKCIKCYCCHEVCPQKAIDLKGGVLTRIADRIFK